MDRLPFETWRMILGHVCTDEEHTGRALSLTCKYFREVSRHARFTSLKLVGAHLHHAFADIVAREPTIRVDVRE